MLKNLSVVLKAAHDTILTEELHLIILSMKFFSAL